MQVQVTGRSSGCEWDGMGKVAVAAVAAVAVLAVRGPPQLNSVLPHLKDANATTDAQQKQTFAAATAAARQRGNKGVSVSNIYNYDCLTNDVSEIGV